MPNKRKDGKKSKNIWLTKEEADMLERLKDILGVDGTSAIKIAIAQYAKEKGIVEDERKND